LSNARLDTPWPKVVLGKTRLRTLLEKNELDHDTLAAVVGDRQLAEPQDLQRHGLINGMDQILSAQFITAGSYGTRSSTTLWRDREGFVRWRESSFDESGKLASQRQESFCLTGGTPA
jgi:uncharacterized protein with NRDE domain